MNDAATLRVAGRRASITGLRLLGLQNNGLSTLPIELGQLTGLRILELSRNRLTELPPGVGRLSWLRVLSLDENDLTRLPRGLGGAFRLKVLWLKNNQISVLSPELFQLDGLLEIDLRGNPLTDADRQLATLGRQLPNTRVRW